MLGTAAMVIFFLLAPAGVLHLCRKVSLFGKIGPVLILYILGILAGNLFHPEGMAEVQDLLSSAMVPLAIPLMLFGCTFSRSETRSQLLALITGLFAVVAAVVAGFFIFRSSIPDADKVGALLAGVYTGGTVNMASLKTMLDVPDETFILLNSYDMVICFLYLTALLSFGIRLTRRWLPCETIAGSAEDDKAIEDALNETRSNPYKGIFTRDGLKNVGILLAIDAAIIGVSAGLGLLAGQRWFMTVLILMLTTLGIAASFCKKIRKLRYSNETGMYFIYVFSIVVASMADLSKMDLSGGICMLGYLTFVLFVSFIIQLLLAKLFRIDADTMAISSVAFICSPPFVPMISAAMRNRRVLASGLAIGVAGYAAGNYLGFLIANIL